MENDINKQISDPSALTTALTQREIAALKDLVFTEIEAIKKSIKVAHEDVVRVPTEVQKQVGSLKELLLNKIEDRAKLVDEKFLLAESARVEQKRDSAASINKSEQSFSKIIDQQGNLISSITTGFNDQTATMTKGFYDQLDGLKDRLTRIESIAVGALGQKTDKRDMDKIFISVAGIIVAIIFGIMGYILNK